jgi:hypothetical protein
VELLISSFRKRIKKMRVMFVRHQGTTREERIINLSVAIGKGTAAFRKT